MPPLYVRSRQRSHQLRWQSGGVAVVAAAAAGTKAETCRGPKAGRQRRICRQPGSSAAKAAGPAAWLEEQAQGAEGRPCRGRAGRLTTLQLSSFAYESNGRAANAGRLIMLAVMARPQADMSA